MQPLAIGIAIADKGVPCPTANAAIKAILASVSEVPGRYRRAPTDGVCACALAFSTLLSSQGADAHHRSALAGIRGNPSNLPASLGPVKSRSAGSSIAYQLAASFSLPAVRDHPFPGSVPQAVLLASGWSEGADPPAAFRVPRGRRNIRQQSGFRQIEVSPTGHRSFTCTLTCAARPPRGGCKGAETPASPSIQQKSAKKNFRIVSLTYGPPGPARPTSAQTTSSYPGNTRLRARRG